MLCKDATHMIKTVLVGTATKKLTSVVEAAFRGDEPPELQNIYDEVPKEEEEEEPTQPEEVATPSTSKGGKHKQTPLSAPKGAKSSKSGPFSLENAQVYYPTTADEGSHLHARVDPKSSLHKNQAITLLLSVMVAFIVRFVNQRVKSFPTVTGHVLTKLDKWEYPS